MSSPPETPIDLEQVRLRDAESDYRARQKERDEAITTVGPKGERERQHFATSACHAGWPCCSNPQRIRVRRLIAHRKLTHQRCKLVGRHARPNLSRHVSPARAASGGTRGQAHADCFGRRSANINHKPASPSNLARPGNHVQPHAAYFASSRDLRPHSVQTSSCAFLPSPPLPN